MGRYSWSKRIMVENCTAISVFDKSYKPELPLGFISFTAFVPNQKTFFQTITTTPTTVKPNGVRWWFFCPDCGERVAKLYLPPGRVHLKCRICYNLTYQSQKERYGQMENFWAKILMEDGIQNRETARKAYRNIFRKFIFNRHRR